MKICLVCPFPLNVPGGVREHVFGLYKEFKKKGHKVKIIFPRGWRKKEEHPEIILLGVYIRIPWNKDWGVLALCDNSDQKIQKILKKEKFDVIHYHEPRALFLCLQILRHSKSLNIATFHSNMDATNPFVKAINASTKRLQSYLANKLDAAIVVSEPAKRYSEKILKEEPVNIPNGVDLSRFSPKAGKLKQYQDGKLNILFVGRLNKRKGIMYLLRAFRRLKKIHKDIRLIIVGGGDQGWRARQYVSLQEIEDVSFEGTVSDEVIPAYYTTADIFCSPATEGESFGIVLLEAMASGTPIVAYANAGYSWVLKGFGKKSLVPPKSVTGLTERLEELIENKKLRKDLAKWGLKEVKKFSWEKVANQVLGVYQKASKIRGGR